MSRVGKKPISIPDKTKVSYKDRVVTVQGKNGTLTQQIHPDVEVNIEKDVINISLNDQSRKTVALQGMTRSLLNNMVTGVTNGFERVLEINGIGYRAELKGKSIIFNLGYSHPIDFPLPEGVSAKVDKNNVVTISGIDKQLIGQTAARIRQLRPPEPYKGKGIKYAEEHIIRKAGKTGTK
ncbi:MAG: 50S ribosomal protein L6 [Desulfobacteraceae bacterium]|jgi:large subunit ribosomal protein L6